MIWPVEINYNTRRLKYFSMNSGMDALKPFNTVQPGGLALQGEMCFPRFIECNHDERKTT
jgi:hypothetical protein